MILHCVSTGFDIIQRNINNNAKLMRHSWLSQCMSFIKVKLILLKLLSENFIDIKITHSKHKCPDNN